LGNLKFGTEFENGLVTVFWFFQAGDSFFKILSCQALKSQPCQPLKEIHYFVMQAQLYRGIPLKKFKLNMKGNLICRNSLMLFFACAVAVAAAASCC
jgi:hypothetical protein